MKTPRWLFLVALVIMVWMPASYASADGPPVCAFNPNGNITCTISGGSGDHGGGGGGNTSEPTPIPFSCAPGQSQMVNHQVYYPVAGGQCSLVGGSYDVCSSEWITVDSIGEPGDCPEAANPPPRHPCTSFVVTGGGITCNGGDGWHIVATVRFPENYFDVRPYPATLVRWPTAIRNGGMPSASGSGSQDYYGAGLPGNPRVGDWSNITLTLTLNPAGSMYVTLPQVGSLILSDQGATGTPHIIQWEVPSHPAVGGGPLAGSISGLGELPADLPLFVGRGRSPYRLFWRLSWYAYEGIEECLPGPNGNGVYNCANDTGHKAITGYEWRRHSRGGEIPPTAVQGLPAALAADLNGDGSPEAYWNNNLTIRRMDDANRVDNPTYRRSWNWGGMIYWGVREGQGQIGWPEK
jgi:hypothetical protein